MLHHCYIINLIHYYIIITNGKSCNNDSIIMCYAKSKTLLLHYYYVLFHHDYTWFYYYPLLPISVSQTCRWICIKCIGHVLWYVSQYCGMYQVCIAHIIMQQTQYIPIQTGIYSTHTCWYWIHTATYWYVFITYHQYITQCIPHCNHNACQSIRYTHISFIDFQQGQVFCLGDRLLLSAEWLKQAGTDTYLHRHRHRHSNTQQSGFPRAWAWAYHSKISTVSSSTAYSSAKSSILSICNWCT